MIESATAINNLSSHAMQADFVQSSEDAVFILNSSQLQAIIENAIQPLVDRISSLEATSSQPKQ